MGGLELFVEEYVERMDVVEGGQAWRKIPLCEMG